MTVRIIATLSLCEESVKPQAPSNSFCILPWIHRFTNIGGEIQVCCTSEEMDNNILDNQGKPMNAKQGWSDEAVINSDFMKKVRLQMLEGSLPNFCNRCVVTEKTGSQSRRQSENKHFADLVDSALLMTESDGKIPVHIKSVDMRLGNICNLACRMCSPRSSQKWISEWKQLEYSFFEMPEELEKSYLSYDWYKKPEVIDSVVKSLPHLRHLHFAGGEPLIMPEMVKILKASVELGYSKNIEVSYNTNITRLPKDVVDLWPHFKGIRLMCSIDGYGSLNEYIRHPSKWIDIDRNLSFLEENFERLKLISVHIMCTVQAYNIMSLPDLFNYLKNFKKVDCLPHLIDLHYPIFYRSQILPKDFKKAVTHKMAEIYKENKEKIEKNKIAYPSQIEAALHSIDGILEFMNLENREEELLNFMKSARTKDKVRKQSIFDIDSKWREIFFAAKVRENINTDFQEPPSRFL